MKRGVAEIQQESSVLMEQVRPVEMGKVKRIISELGGNPKRQGLVIEPVEGGKAQVLEFIGSTAGVSDREEILDQEMFREARSVFIQEIGVESPIKIFTRDEKGRIFLVKAI